jgi:hypothetical protein
MRIAPALAYMISSPPEEAEHIRGKTLTPESPKPVHYPSPSNIPILEKQMDPMFHESTRNIGNPAAPYPYQPTQTPSAQSASSLYADQHTAQNYQNAGAQGTYGNGFSTQSQDTSSIQNYPSQNQAPSSYSEATPTQYQDTRPAYPSSYDPNAYATQQPQAQPSQGAQYQPQADAGGGVNYQALLDILTPSAEKGPSDRYTASSVNPQPAHAQGQAAATSSLPAAPNLPPRPPPQDESATNSSPNGDIRSYHPHSQKSANNQFRGPGPLQPLNVRSGGGTSQDGHSATRSNQSPTTPGYGKRLSVDLLTPGLDDEDIRWPAEINKLYEEFLDDERKYVTDGQWDQFPMGSRLFIGEFAVPIFDDAVLTIAR